MAETIYNYPKSSCTCYVGQPEYTLPTEGYPTNMSVKNCDFPKYLDYHDKIPFGSSLQPTLKQGISLINPQIFTDNFSPDFTPVEGKSDGCPPLQFYSNDPRLISSAHDGQVLTLDRPPLVSSMQLDKIASDKNLDGYGQNYNTYSDVNAGQIVYYIDKSIEDPFFLPNFVTTAQTDSYLYQDPMGAIKPQYMRRPIFDDNVVAQKRDNYEGGLSWMQDSLGHRQDLTSLQRRKFNETRYEPRWKTQ